MLRFKSSQADSFSDGNVRRLLSYISTEQYNCQQKLQTIEQIFQEFENIKMQGQLQISLKDIQGDAGLWQQIQSVLGDEHWSLNPSKGI